MPTILLTFLRAYWSYVAIGVAVLAVASGIYWEGGRAPRAQLAQERAERDAAEEEFEFFEVLHEERSDELVAQANEAGKILASGINNSWQNVVWDLEDKRSAAIKRALDAEQRLRDGKNRGGPAAKPVPEPTGGGSNAAEGNGLPDAVERYVAEVRSVVAGERAETARLLQVCEGQTGQLTIVQKWAAGEKVLNQPETAPGGKPLPAKPIVNSFSDATEPF